MISKANKKEYILITVFSLLLVAFSIIAKSDLLTFSCCFIAIFTAYLLAKGKPIGNIFGIGLVVLYTIISWNAKLYGEVFLYIFVMLPLYTISIYTWLKNYSKEKKTTLVNNIKEIEWAFICLVQPTLFAIVYYTLSVLNTNQLFFSTLSFTTLITTVYLGVRRNKYSFLFYFLNDIALVILWGAIIFNGQWALLPILISPIISCYYDIFGIFKWNELRYYITTIDQIEYRILRKKDEDDCIKVIKECTKNLDPEVFIPFDENELNKIFNSSYCEIYGAFDKDELIGISQIYKSGDLFEECIRQLNIEEAKSVQIGGDLEYEEYNNKNVIKNLIKMQLKYIRSQDYEYVIAISHPKYKKYNNIFKELNFKCVKTAKINEKYLRNLYLIKL